MKRLIDKLENARDFYADDPKCKDSDLAVGIAQGVNLALNIVKQHQVTESEWIPCSNPPDSDREVLLWLRFSNLQAQGFYSKSGKWHDPDGNLIDNKILSFWHELPQPPSEV